MNPESAKEERETIDLSSNRDLIYWCEEFNLGIQELKDIVREVGPSVQAIRQYLANRMLGAWPLNY